MKPSVESLMEEIKAVIFMKDKFEYRDMSILIVEFLSLFLAHQDPKSHVRKKINDFPSTDLLKKLSIETFMEKMMQALLKEYEFKGWDLFGLKTQFGFSSLSGFQCKKIEW